MVEGRIIRGRCRVIGGSGSGVLGGIIGEGFSRCVIRVNLIHIIHVVGLRRVVFFGGREDGCPKEEDGSNTQDVFRFDSTGLKIRPENLKTGGTVEVGIFDGLQGPLVEETILLNPKGTVRELFGFLDAFMDKIGSMGVGVGATAVHVPNTPAFETNLEYTFVTKMELDGVTVLEAEKSTRD